MGPIPAEAIRVPPSGDSLVGPSGWEVGARSWLRGNLEDTVHVVGVGNPIRQDDAVGLEIVASLRRRLGPRPTPKVVIHPPSLMPERILSRVAAQGGRLMVFDAVEANRRPGSIVCANLADTKFGFFATHNVPLRLIPGVAGSLEGSLVIGIQPESLDVGEGLSATVTEAKGRVVAAMGAIIGGLRDGPP